MKRKIFTIVLIVALAIGAYLGWAILGPAGAFKGDRYFLYIRTGMNYDEVTALLQKDDVLKHPSIFDQISQKMGYPANVKAGKYEIRKSMNLIAILRMLKNGRQVPVNLVITKLRTREDLASLIGRKFECDSASFINYIQNKDSLQQYGLDSNTVMSAVFPTPILIFGTPIQTGSLKNFLAPIKLFGPTNAYSRQNSMD